MKTKFFLKINVTWGKMYEFLFRLHFLIKDNSLRIFLASLWLLWPGRPNMATADAQITQCVSTSLLGLLTIHLPFLLKMNLFQPGIGPKV